jgi:hypothetical protein
VRALPLTHECSRRGRSKTATAQSSPERPVKCTCDLTACSQSVVFTSQGNCSAEENSTTRGDTRACVRACLRACMLACVRVRMRGCERRGSCAQGRLEGGFVRPCETMKSGLFPREVLAHARNCEYCQVVIYLCAVKLSNAHCSRRREIARAAAHILR